MKLIKLNTKLYHGAGNQLFIVIKDSHYKYQASDIQFCVLQLVYMFLWLVYMFSVCSFVERREVLTSH